MKNDAVSESIPLRKNFPWLSPWLNPFNVSSTKVSGLYHYQLWLSVSSGQCCDFSWSKGQATGRGSWLHNTYNDLFLPFTNPRQHNNLPYPAVPSLHRCLLETLDLKEKNQGPPFSRVIKVTFVSIFKPWTALLMHWTPAHHRLRWCEQQRPGLKKRIGFCENLYGFQLLEVCSFLGELSKNCFLGEFDPSTWKLAVITPKLHQKKPPFCGSGTFLVPPAVHCWIQSRPQRPLQDLASLLHCENRLFCFLRVMKLNPRDIHVLVHDCSSGVGHVHGAWNSFIISRHLANQNLFHLLQTKALSQEMEAHTQPRNATSNRNLIMCSMGKVKCSWKTSNKTNKTNDSPGPFWFYLTIHSQSHAFSSWDPCHGVAPTQAPSSPTAVHVWVAIGKEWSFAQKVSSSAFLHILRKKSKSAPTSPSLLQLLPAQHQQPKEKKKVPITI